MLFDAPILLFKLSEGHVNEKNYILHRPDSLEKLVAICNPILFVKFMR